jgi:integrase
MAKHKLDATFCLTAQCKPGRKRTDYYDEIVRGFVLEVRANAGKTYYLRYQDQHGTQRQHKIAAYGDITFDKAKKEAMRLRSEVVLGGDPAAKKAEKKAVPTYGELADDHIKHARTYARSIKTIEGYIDNHIRPRWGKVRLTDIHPRDVSKWLAEKREGGLAPATVEKIRVIFGRSFALAAGWGVAGSERNPTKGVSRPKFTNARERFLTAGEAGRLREAVAASRNTQLRYIVGLLLLTGARVSELLNAEWRHVDVERRAWHIPISKTGKSRHVPLSQAALDLITALPKFKDCPYLVPNPETLKPFVSVKHSWQTARDEAKLSGLRIHDLRHSAASFMINSGVDLFAVGKVLGHASYQSTQRYSHLANDTLLAAVEAGAKKQNGA